MSASSVPPISLTIARNRWSPRHPRGMSRWKRQGFAEVEVREPARMGEYAAGYEPSGSSAANAARHHHVTRADSHHRGRSGDDRPEVVAAGVALTAEQRLVLERVVGVAVLLTVGSRSGSLQEDPVAALHKVTRDGVVLGVALGTALAAAELDGWRSYRELAEVYRRAGADERVAAAELAWQRDRSPRG
jgi:hypothetical protein